jgi:PAS domain S-box-containing protein
MRPELRILIVDDSPEDAMLIIRELQKEFIPIYKRVESPEGLKQELRNNLWDVIVSDYVMPQFSGLAALSIVQQNKLDLPFIMVSGQMGEDMAVESMRSGAQDYLIKDNLSRLIPAIKRELNEAKIRVQRRDAEESLRATENRFQSLVEHSLVGIYLLQNTQFTYVNPKFARIFGYQQNDIIDAKTFLDLVPEEDKQNFSDNFLQPLTERTRNLHYFFQGRRKDSVIIEIEAHGTRTELNGNPAIIGTILDITERKHSEDELRKLWRALEQSPVSVIITDIKGNIEYVNPKFSLITGYELEEILGKNPRFLKSGSTNPEIYKELWNTIISGGEWHGEFQNRKKNGDLFYESVSISPIRNSEGQITHYVGVKEDITERKKAVEHLRQVQKMEAIGQLAGGIAHDFNNLLTIINGYSTILIRSIEAESPHHREAMQILKAGERAADLTRQLLSFSRKQILEPKVININLLIKSVENMLSRLIGEHLHLITNINRTVGLIKIDPGQIEQIIINLVVNARDASETGGRITIETDNCTIDEAVSSLTPDLIPGKYVILSVSDEGIGMTDDVKRRIFEPFFTTKELGRGTGLGLATVYGIVKQNGGYLEVNSQPDKGTTFKIFIPQAYQETELDVTCTNNKLPHGNQTILVVEDEPGVLELVVSTLSSNGYNILKTTDPLEAISIFEENKANIDLLLTDVVMPFMSGPKLAETLSELKPGLKVILMSGHTDDRISLEKILAKGVPFIPKPFANGALLSKVAQTLGNSIYDEIPGYSSGGKN